MSTACQTWFSPQIRPLCSNPNKKYQISLTNPSPFNRFPLKITKTAYGFHPSRTATPLQTPISDNKQPPDQGIPIDQVKSLVKFKSRFNFIRVLEISRKTDHPFAGSRLLLLDNPGNIHSISFLFKTFTNTYFDVFATFPPILPPGPLGILGFGAGSAAKLIFELYPPVEIHGWELDPSVISVGREFFGLSQLEKQNPNRLFIYIGDALKADIRDGFSGILVDLFCKGTVIPELQDPNTWVELKNRLRKGGKIMVNCGGSCVEAEDPRRDGHLVMKETLKAIDQVFGGELFVLNVGQAMEDSCIAVTGPLPDPQAWKKALPSSLRFYVDKWILYSHFMGRVVY